MNEIMIDVLIGISALTLVFIMFPYIIHLFRWIFTTTKFNTLGSSSQIRLIRQLYEAVQELSAKKTGAIITIVNKEPLDHLRTDGIMIDANISSILLLSIFNKHSPLHDGAVIIEGAKIKYAATYFKITQSSINNRYGARHRAGLGIAEQSDSITIIVSEETGGVSIARNGKLLKIQISKFQEELIEILKN